MIYKVTIYIPAFHEEVTTAADDPEQARADAVNSAYQRLITSATVTVEEAGQG